MFNIGDTVWVAHYGLIEKTITCPVCFGKRQVTLILGNDDRVTMDCKFCAPGYDPPRGTITEYVTEAEVIPHVVTGREISERGAQAEVRYVFHDQSSRGPDAVFSTQEEAEVKARALAAEGAKEREEKAFYLKKDNQKSYSWNAGYHLREAKRMREGILYHERMAVLCKAKAKAE